MALSKDKIRAKAQERYGIQNRGEVEVPEWADEDGDCAVLVRGMTFRELMRWQAKQGSSDGDDAESASLAFIVRCVIDESGEQVFDDGDMNKLAENPASVCNALANRILELSGFGATKDEQKAIEAEIAGESEPLNSNS